MVSTIVWVVLIAVLFFWHMKGGWRQKVEVGFRREYTLFGWPTGLVVGTGTWWLTPFPGIISLLKPIDIRSKTIKGREISDIWLNAERLMPNEKAKRRDVEDVEEGEKAKPVLDLLAYLRVKCRAVADLQYRIKDVHRFQTQVKPEELEDLITSRMAHYIRQAFISMHPVHGLSKRGQEKGSGEAEGLLKKEMEAKGVEVEELSLITLDPVDPEITKALESMTREEIEAGTDFKDTETVVRQAQEIVRGMGMTSTSAGYQAAVEKQVLVILTTRAQQASADKKGAIIIPPGAVQINLGGGR